MEKILRNQFEQTLINIEDVVTENQLLGLDFDTYAHEDTGEVVLNLSVTLKERDVLVSDKSETDTSIDYSQVNALNDLSEVLQSISIAQAQPPVVEVYKGNTGNWAVRHDNL